MGSPDRPVQRGDGRAVVPALCRRNNYHTQTSMSIHQVDAALRRGVIRARSARTTKNVSRRLLRDCEAVGFPVGCLYGYVASRAAKHGGGPATPRCGPGHDEANHRACLRSEPCFRSGYGMAAMAVPGNRSHPGRCGRSGPHPPLSDMNALTPMSNACKI